MKLGPRDSYLCLIPPSTEQNSPAPEDSHTEWTPAQGWSLLQPLTGSCIYVRPSLGLSIPHRAILDAASSIDKAGSHTPTVTTHMSVNSER